jgi:RND family efflux transporter MFP subunit
MKIQIAEAEAKAKSAESMLKEAEARQAAFESTFERLRSAAATPGAIAGNELVQAEKTVEAAKASVAASRSAAAAADASIQALRQMESYLNVTAPFAGVVTERLVHPGALVGPAAGAEGVLLRLEETSRLRLVVAVPEANVAGIARGGRVPFKVAAYPGQTFTGTVARIAHSMDPKTRTMSVELDVANAGLQLAPGMYPEVNWPVKSGKAAMLVPATAVVTTTERTFVVRDNGGRAEWVDVRKGAAAGDLVEVMGALKPGDSVVRRGTDEIRPGYSLSGISK